MQNPTATWVALCGELASTSLDPTTMAEIDYGILPAGTKVADPAPALAAAAARGDYTVVVRVQGACGRVQLERVVVRALREALARKGAESTEHEALA